MTVLDRRPEPFQGGIVDQAVMRTGRCPYCQAPYGNYHGESCAFGGIVGSYQLPDRHWSKVRQPWRPSK